MRGHARDARNPPTKGRSAVADYAKPVPVATPETQDFWDGAKRGELRLQRCDECDQLIFPPRPFCTKCSSRSVSSFTASGRGKLYSYVINHRPAPAFGEDPYAIAIVELDEGPRMMSNIVECEQTPEALVLDMPLEVAFESITDEISLPKFRPARGN